jgi:hypothetical protein
VLAIFHSRAQNLGYLFAVYSDGNVSIAPAKTMAARLRYSVDRSVIFSLFAVHSAKLELPRPKEVPVKFNMTLKGSLSIFIYRSAHSCN